MSAPCLDYKDTVTLVFVTTDDYGQTVPDEEVEVRGLVVLDTGHSHSANQEAITSDAQVYLDPSDENVIAQHYRLEEAYMRLGLFGTPAADDWYQVSRVDIARDILLGNQIDNVTLSLRKVGDMAYVS